MAFLTDVGVNSHNARALLRQAGSGMGMWVGIDWECDLVSHLTTVGMTVGFHSMGLWVGLAGKVTLKCEWAFVV